MGQTIRVLLTGAAGQLGQALIASVPEGVELIADSAGDAGNRIGVEFFVEGFDGGSDAEFVRFLRYSQRSCSEVQSQLYRAFDRLHITSDEFDEFWEDNGPAFLAFWAELAPAKRAALLQLTKDGLVRKVRERLFSEKHVDCNLALDVLYNAAEELRQQVKRGRGGLVNLL